MLLFLLYHFAEKLEDTIRYSGTDTPLIAEVIATGIIDEGFDEYLSKPINMTELNRLINGDTVCKI